MKLPETLDFYICFKKEHKMMPHSDWHDKILQLLTNKRTSGLIKMLRKELKNFAVKGEDLICNMYHLAKSTENKDRQNIMYFAIRDLKTASHILNLLPLVTQTNNLCVYNCYYPQFNIFVISQLDWKILHNSCIT